MASKDDMIADLRRLVDALRQEVAELRLQLAKASKDSSNSSKSPSSDITGAGKNTKKNKPGRPKKRTAGGQPGRVRKLRDRLPADRVDEVVQPERSRGTGPADLRTTPARDDRLDEIPGSLQLHDDRAIFR